MPCIREGKCQLHLKRKNSLVTKGFGNKFYLDKCLYRPSTRLSDGLETSSKRHFESLPHAMKCKARKVDHE